MKKSFFIFIVITLVVPVILSAQSGNSKPATWPAGMIFKSDNIQNPPSSYIEGNGSRELNYLIDQNQPVIQVYMAQFMQTDLAQSFIPSANKICGAGLVVWNYGNNTGDITIMLYNNLPNAGGNLLASGTSGFSFGEDMWSTWVDVSWPSVNITPGNTYYLVFTCTNPYVMLSGSIDNPYPYGMVYANPGYYPFPNFDYTFRTYSCDTMVETPVSNWAVYMAIALMGIAVTWVVIRRRA